MSLSRPFKDLPDLQTHPCRFQGIRSWIPSASTRHGHCHLKVAHINDHHGYCECDWVWLVLLNLTSPGQHHIWVSRRAGLIRTSGPPPREWWGASFQRLELSLYSRRPAQNPCRERQPVYANMHSNFNQYHMKLRSSTFMSFNNSTASSGVSLMLKAVWIFLLTRSCDFSQTYLNGKWAMPKIAGEVVYTKAITHWNLKPIPLEIKHEAQSYPRYKRVGQPSILSKSTFLPSAPKLRCAQWKCFTNHVNFNEGSQAKQLFRRSEVISLGQSNHHALQPWERSLYLSPSGWSKNTDCKKQI